MNKMYGVSDIIWGQREGTYAGEIIPSIASPLIIRLEEALVNRSVDLSLDGGAIRILQGALYLDRVKRRNRTGSISARILIGIHSRARGSETRQRARGR